MAKSSERIAKSCREREAILLDRGFQILARYKQLYKQLYWSTPRDSVVGFLMRRAPGDVALANRLILDWTRAQNRDVKSRHFGTGFTDNTRPAYDDGSFPTPFNIYNIFAAPDMAILFKLFGADLTPTVRRACLETMRNGLFEYLVNQCLPLSIHNVSYGIDTGLIIYGTLLDQPAIMKQGLYRLLHHLQLGTYLEPMHEYNSPTYMATILDLLSGVIAVTRRHDVRMAARIARERILLVAAGHYHFPTHELAPPHFRAYHGTLSKYAGGMGAAIFKMTGDLALISDPDCDTHDFPMNFAFAAFDMRISEPMRKLFLQKSWPFETREVHAYGFPSIPARVNPWPEVTSFYPDHATRSARMLAAVPVRFDEAVPRDVATTYMTRVYALGSFACNALSTPYGYGRWHRRGLQFYYRPRLEPELYPMRYGFLGFPNAGPTDDPDNEVACTSIAGQHRNIVLALYRMAPKRTNACEVFCSLQVADGGERFYDAKGPLTRGRPAQGPLFIHDGECYLAFLKSGSAELRVEDRDPALTCYSFYQTKAVPAIVLSHYRGPCRTFTGKTIFEGGLALVMGDAEQYGNFERFRKIWSRVQLVRHVHGALTELVLAGVKPVLRLRARTGLNEYPEFFIAGKLQKSDTLESPFARQSHTGQPVRVGPFRVESSGKPVTAYAAPDGSGCVVLQTLPIPVDITVTAPGGAVRVKGLPLGRIELTLDPCQVLIEACAPPKALTATGLFTKCKRVLHYK